MNTHFIGIGGIGMSALARYFLSRGDIVSGSDIAESEITRALRALGVRIYIGQNKPRIPSETERIIYTAAVNAKNAEFREAKKRRLLLQSYPEAIGELTRCKPTITVSGSHGKSTTTALAALVLEEGHFDPTVILGTKLREFGGTNFRSGHGPFLVLEADEWNKSFLNYSPKIAIITNIDAEHLDTYKTVEGVMRAFDAYLKRVHPRGLIIANFDDPRVRKIAKKFGTKVRWFSQEKNRAEVTRLERVLKIPGAHNVSNALAALTLGRALAIPEHAILSAISRFSGAWRRFEFLGITNNVYIFTDYAHHPREIAATLEAARERFPFRRIWCVYQPHQQERLAALWGDFIGAFDLADRIVLLPVYAVAGREKKKTSQRINSHELSRELVRRGKNATFIHTFARARRAIREETRPGDVLFFMGAGDIYTLATDYISVY